jgi:hypothetical protein
MVFVDAFLVSCASGSESRYHTMLDSFFIEQWVSMIRMLEMSSDSIGKGFNVAEMSPVGEWALRV